MGEEDRRPVVCAIPQADDQTVADQTIRIRDDRTRWDVLGRGLGNLLVHLVDSDSESTRGAIPRGQGSRCAPDFAGSGLVCSPRSPVSAGCFAEVRSSAEPQWTVTGERQLEWTDAVTTLPPARATPVEVPALGSEHRAIEDNLDAVHDACVDDRVGVRTGRIPRVTAALRDAVIATAGLIGQTAIAAAARRFAAHPAKLAVVGPFTDNE